MIISASPCPHLKPQLGIAGTKQEGEIVRREARREEANERMPVFRKLDVFIMAIIFLSGKDFGTSQKIFSRKTRREFLRN